MPTVTRHLLLILGDQLDPGAPLLRGGNKSTDKIWMAEASEESEHVWSSKPRTTLFLSAMRHFRDTLREKDWEVDYTELTARSKKNSLANCLDESLQRLKPSQVRLTQPGDWRVLRAIQAVCKKANIPLEILEDAHFLCSLPDFTRHAGGRKSLRMEFFYREMRRKHGVLMEKDNRSPVGGEWNYDSANRQSFGKSGPGELPAPPRFEPDAITRQVMDLVEKRFGDHPGELSDFQWPTTPAEATRMLDHFIEHALPRFGRYQDAMWENEPFLYHSLLSSSLNLKLLNPRTVLEAAETAWIKGKAPIEAVEGFIRQILGWREYVRGIYWLQMPEYLEKNALEAAEDLPSFYWNAETPMHCLRQAIGQTLRHGYAHHIQRLMVTGLYALLLGVRPRQVHEWYLAVYVDAVEWVELPNTLGMSQYGDGGIMASKPYAASGKYIQRMSNYCQSCPFNPTEATGDGACPFTTLYWDFLLRNETRLKDNPRVTLQLRNLQRLKPARRTAIRTRAEALRRDPSAAGFPQADPP